MKKNLVSAFFKVVILGLIIATFFLILSYRKKTLERSVISSFFHRIYGDIQPNNTENFLPRWAAEDFTKYGENYYFSPDWDGSFIKTEEEVKTEDGVTLFKYYLAIDAKYKDENGRLNTVRIPIIVSDSKGNLGYVDFRSEKTPRNLDEMTRLIESSSRNPDGSVRKASFVLIGNYEKFYRENSQYPTGWFGETVITYYNQPYKKKQLKEFIKNGDSDIHIMLPQIKEFYVPIN